MIFKDSTLINTLLQLPGKIFKSLLPVCLISFSLTTGNVLAGIPLDRIVAVINEDVIMQSELEERIRTVIKQMAQQGAERPPQDVLAKQVLERMIMIKLQTQFAERTGIKVDDESLNQTINQIAAGNNLSLSQFREILEQDGIDYESFREDIRNEITIAQLKRRQVDNRVSVTEREIDNFLANEEVQGSTENEYQLSHILISAPEGATQEETDQARLVAEKVVSDLNSGISFEELARTVSDGQQAESGGDLGWRKESEIPTLFADEISNMQEGEISDIIESPSGFHIIKLAGLRSSDKNIVTQTQARHILIRPNELVSEKDALSRLSQLKLRLEGGDDFSELARSHSDDPGSAVNGGDLGWVNPGQMVPEFEERMNRLEAGQISEPFKTQFGFHIVQVLDRREQDNTEQLKRARAREILMQRKIEEAQQNWLRSLRDEAYVEYRLDGS